MQEKTNNFASPHSTLRATLLGVGFFLIVATPFFVFAQVAPTVDIKANGQDGPITINSGAVIRVTWSVTNATSCFASGSWGGNKPDSGSETFQNITSTQIYSLTCVNSAGPSTFDSVTVKINIIQPRPPTVDIKANNSDGPITIQSGTQANLAWTSSNAISCQASSGPWFGVKPLNSSEATQVLFQPATYTITCQNSVGQTAIDSVTVNIQQQPQNPSVDIKANGSDNPSTIPYNSAANLSWTSANATTCFASGGPWSGTKPLNSSEASVSLTQTTTFGITCVGTNNQNVSDTVTVPVGTQTLNPTVDIKANNSDGPISIQSGTQANLAWTSSNATSCQASSGPWFGVKPLNSSEATQVLFQSVTYTITCQNSVGQTANDSVTVNIQPQTQNPSVDIKANGSDGPVNVAYNSSATLSWTSANTTSCSASGGSWSGSRGLNDSESTGNLTQSRTYSITCQNSAGQTANDSVTVNVNSQSNPPTVTIYASPSLINYGSQSHLYWSSSNATSCQAAGGSWSGTKPLNSDEYTQTLYQTSTYTITCQNAQGQTATQSTTVSVQGSTGGGGGYQYPPTLNLYANPSQVPVGNTATLYWNSTYADYCSAGGDYQNNWTGNKAVNGSQLIGPIFSTQNFTLTCTGPGGSITRNTTVSPVGQVLGAATPTLTVYALPSPVQYGASSNIYWNSTNANYCNASGGWFGGKPTSGQEPTGPLFTDKTYTVTCFGQGGTITRSAVVPVIGTPIYIPPVVIPVCPASGCVRGVAGSYATTIDKTIENLGTGTKGAQVSARPGNELRYTITVRNTGTLALTNLTVRDVLSDRVELRTASDSATYNYENRTVTWKIARLGAGESKTITITVRVIQCDTDIVIENRAYVKGAQIDEVSSNNTVAGVSTSINTINGNGSKAVSDSNKDAQFAAVASASSSRGLAFLPNTFFGWLLLLLLIIVLAIFIKRLLTKD